MTRTKPEIKKAAKTKEQSVHEFNMATGLNLQFDNPRQPKIWIKILLTAIQWLVVAAVLFFFLRGFHYRIPETRPMPGSLVILFGLSAAYVWVDVLRIGVTKPFNCLTCMCGWICLVLAFAFHTHYWYLYLSFGAFVGGLFTSIKLRWL